MRILSAEHTAGIKKLIFSLLPIPGFAAFTMFIDAKYMLIMFVLQCIMQAPAMS